MGSRTLQPTDPDAKPYEDRRKSIEEETAKVRAARAKKLAPAPKKREEQR